MNKIIFGLLLLWITFSFQQAIEKWHKQKKKNNKKKILRHSCATFSRSGDVNAQKVSVLFGVKCRLIHLSAQYIHTPTTTTTTTPSPSLLPGGISGPVWEWLWSATVGIWQRPWFGEPPHAEPHSAASALWGWEVSVSHTTQWPPQRRLQAPAHSCRDLGAAQVRGGPG